MSLATPLSSILYKIYIQSLSLTMSVLINIPAQNGSCDSVVLRMKDEEDPTAIPRNKTGKAFAYSFQCTLQYYI